MISDGVRSRSDSVERNARVLVLCALVAAVLAVYTMRLFSMQVVSGDEYQQQSRAISSQTSVIPAQRGEIFDRDGILPIVVNTDSFAVDIVPGEIPDGYFDTVITRLANLLGVPKSDIDRRVPASQRRRTNFSSIEVKTNVSFAVISNIAENVSDLPGVSWRLRSTRNYVETGSMSHVVGYVGAISTEERRILYNEDERYRSSNVTVGKTGIEKEYDLLLQGVPGRESRTIDVRGHVLSEEPVVTPPRTGNSLVLTIDSAIQALVEKALGERVGAAVVLKPASGEVLAMVSYPYFDANIFSSDDWNSEYIKLTNDPNKPMLNRAVNAGYAPASTFKVIMSAAMLAENAFPSEKKVECAGRIQYGDRWFHCHIGGAGHGWLDLRNGLAQSCNIYYWTVGRDYLGVDKIAYYAREFGYGQPLGIDLPAQTSGFVPTAAWKERQYHQKWLGGDTMNMSIGQSYTLATPMHVADMMAMVTNGGTIYRPHILKEVRSSGSGEVVETVEPEVLFRSNIPQKVWNEIRSDLRYTVTNGSAQYPLRNKVVKIAGKTGTAEVGLKSNWHSWFVAYAPYDAPVEDQVVVAVLVEAVNKWEWWAPYASNIILQGIFADQTYDQAIDALGFRYLQQPVGRQE